LLLLFVLGKYAWGPMLEGLQNRERAIHGALEEAQKARAEAQRIRAQLQDEMNHAHEKVRDLLDAGRRDAARSTEEMIGKARTEIQGERERLRREIDLARDQALQELWSQTAHLATQISAKAIRRELTTDDHRRLVDEALAELRHAGGTSQRQAAGARS
jgi:F-type H+-transporting ATPase subunit b